MSDEQKAQLENIARWFLIGLFAYLYSEGGVHDLFIRRYLGPFVLGVGCFLLSRDWRYLVLMPLQMATLTIGYGSDIVWVKILKRSIWGIANGLSFGSIFAWYAFSNYFYRYYRAAFIFQMLIVISGSVILGVWNPLASARAEEFTIGVLLALLPVMCARKKIKDFNDVILTLDLACINPIYIRVRSLSISPKHHC